MDMAMTLSEPHPEEPSQENLCKAGDTSSAGENG
jgi:hypothetical protein